ncbi:MAG: glycosyltransferase, partial [Planctomycetaceae bacterium]
MRLLGLFAKAPIPGQAKTRLIPALGAEGAAQVAEAFLRDTARRFQSVAEARWLCYSPAQPVAKAWFEQ